MGGHKDKLKNLLRSWPRGTVAAHAWLAQQGVYRQLVDKYCTSGWLRSVGRGAFVRDGEAVEWPGALYAVQRQLGHHVHVGGKTALALRGSAHFLSPRGSRGSDRVLLVNESKQPLPAWFLRGDWDAKLQVVRLPLFQPATTEGVESLDAGGFDLSVSSRERAILEVLSFVPHKQSFDEAQLLMEGLTTLRPDLVQTLLERCHSIKTKRLFLYLADAAGHSWMKRLQLCKIDLGSGKRVIVKGGTFDAKYQITVPRQVESEAG